MEAILYIEREYTVSAIRNYYQNPIFSFFSLLFCCLLYALYNIILKILYSFLHLLVACLHTNIPGMLNFVAAFPIVLTLRSSFLHDMKLLLFLTKAFIVMILSVKYSGLDIFYYVYP